MSWQVQTAKAHFSKLLERAETEGPQMIVKGGEDRAVVLSIADYRGLIGHQASLLSHLPGGQRIDDLHIERDEDTGRDLAL